MRGMIAALALVGCSIGEECARDRSGLTGEDWVSAEGLAAASAAGVRLCFLDQQVRRARSVDCGSQSQTFSDEWQVERCVRHNRLDSTIAPEVVACIDTIASAPCESLAEGPCVLGVFEPSCR